MVYKTSMDRPAKIVTVATSILFLMIIVVQFFLMTTAAHHISILVVSGLVLVYAIVFAFRPVSYDTSDGLLVIHRLISNVTINQNNIKSVELISREMIGNAFRTFGVGGLFGYFGYFANPKMGKMTWYATRRDKAVLVTTSNNKKIILTPDEPEAFVSGMRR